MVINEKCLNKKNAFKYKEFAIKLVTLFFFVGCAKGEYRINQDELVNFYKKNDYKSAKKITTNKNFLPEKENILLKNLEQGNAYLYNNNACSALHFYNKANQVATDQQTKSIKDGLKTTITEEDGIYYGQTYERSLLNFYTSLANYKIYESGICDQSEIKEEQGKKENNKKDINDNKKLNDDTNDENNKIQDKNDKSKIKQLSEQEKTSFLRASRANILFWDSWIKGRKIEKNDRMYSDDLLLKLWGAFIHEQINTTADLQIAKQLYKDAQNVAKNRYVVYRDFNNQNRSFIDKIDDKLQREKNIEKDNTYTKDIIEYTNRQIQRINKKQNANLAIIIHDDVISLKKTEKSISPVGVGALALVPNATLMSSVLGINTLEYEKPVIQEKNLDYKYYYSFWKNDKKIIEKPLVLAEPISNIAYENLQEKINGIILSTQAKVAKQVAIALGTSYATYIGMSAIDETLGQISALGVYLGYSKIIQNAGIIDTRQWVSLPSNIFMALDNISSGKYKLQIVRRKNAINQPVDKGIVNAKQEELVYSKDIEITDKTTFVDIRL